MIWVASVWALFILAPLAIAVAAYFRRDGASQTFALPIIAVVLCESLVLAFSPEKSTVTQMLGISFFAVVLPWLAVLLFFRLLPLSRGPLVAALGTPLVYFIGLVVAIAVADMSGWVAQ
jgi:hypothetical protein